MLGVFFLVRNLFGAKLVFDCLAIKQIVLGIDPLFFGQPGHGVLVSHADSIHGACLFAKAAKDTAEDVDLKTHREFFNPVVRAFARNDGDAFRWTVGCTQKTGRAADPAVGTLGQEVSTLKAVGVFVLNFGPLDCVGFLFEYAR